MNRLLVISALLIVIAGCATQQQTLNVEQLRIAAERGDAKAQTELGLAYDMGRGVDRNTSEAVRWYRKAAEQGYAEAQYQLGKALHWNRRMGEGVETDTVDAAQWYCRAAEQGHFHAQNALARLVGSYERAPSPAVLGEWCQLLQQQ